MILFLLSALILIKYIWGENMCLVSDDGLYVFVVGVVSLLQLAVLIVVVAGCICVYAIKFATVDSSLFALKDGYPTILDSPSAIAKSFPGTRKCPSRTRSELAATSRSFP